MRISSCSSQGCRSGAVGIVVNLSSEYRQSDVVEGFHSPVAKGGRNFAASKGKHNVLFFIKSNIASPHGFSKECTFRTSRMIV